MVGLTLKVRYTPFDTSTHARKIPETFDRNEILARALDLAAGIERTAPSGSWACGPKWLCPTMPESDVRQRAADGDGVARLICRLRPVSETHYKTVLYQVVLHE